MKTMALVAAALAVTGPAFAYNVDDVIYPEIRCKHFFHGCPEGTPVSPGKERPALK